MAVRSRLRYAQSAIARRMGDPQTTIGRTANALSGGFLINVLHPPTSRNEPRWGHGRPSHPRLATLLARGDDSYVETLEGFKQYRADMAKISMDKVGVGEPHWRNLLLFGLDGVSLYCFTRERAPKRYFEVGSGNSTLFVDRARRDGSTGTEIVSIDPYPRREVDDVCDRSIRAPLESIDLSLFDEIEAGDMVFLDGSHRVFMNSDVTVFFLDVLPELPPGVLVGVHDIHLPDDYFHEQAHRYYSEQYLMACFLLAECPWIKPVLPCWYATRHPTIGKLAQEIVPNYLEGASFSPGSLPAKHPEGVIFWMLTLPRP